MYCISRPSLQPLGRQHFALGLPKAARPEKYKEIQIQSHPEKQDPSGAISNHNCCSSYFAQIHLFIRRPLLGMVELKICPFFWNIPSGPTHPQHLLSICLNPSLVSFWASCSYCIQQPAVKIPRERSSCGASGNWKKAVPSYKISSAISSITGGRSFVLFALLSSHVCEHIV